MFSQLYTIHGLYMNNVVPFVYAFLPGKSKLLYTTLLEIIQQCSEVMDSDFIVSDFELTFTQACTDLFPRLSYLDAYSISGSQFGVTYVTKE